MMSLIASFAPAFLGYGMRFVSNLLELRACYEKQKDSQTLMLSQAYIDSSEALWAIEKDKLQMQKSMPEDKEVKRIRSKIIGLIVVAFWVVPPLIFIVAWLLDMPFITDDIERIIVKSWFGFKSTVTEVPTYQTFQGYPYIWVETIVDSYIQVIKFILGGKVAEMRNPYFVNK